MTTVEYLVFVDNPKLKCSTIESFNHFLQSNPLIKIEKNKFIYKDFPINYTIQDGRIGETERAFFHLKFSVKKEKDIEQLSEALKEIRTILHLLSSNPQILFDGISLYYSQKAYPLIYEVENLMRKLITKFMLINVGVDWTKDRVPDDVKKSINTTNKEITYLHNVDFIQLQHFLFSEKFTIHKDKLITKLKQAKDIQNIDLDEIKQLIPMSNWDKYFEDKVNTSREKLSKLWSDLYDLRCKIAHNKIFSKADLDSVENLIAEINPILNQAIDSLGEIDISEQSRIALEDSIVSNFNSDYAEFMNLYRQLTKNMIGIVDEIAPKDIDNEDSEEDTKESSRRKRIRRSFSEDLRIILDAGLINKNEYFKIQDIRKTRNAASHFKKDISEEELQSKISELFRVVEKLKAGHNK